MSVSTSGGPPSLSDPAAVSWADMRARGKDDVKQNKTRKKEKKQNSSIKELPRPTVEEECFGKRREAPEKERK